MYKIKCDLLNHPKVKYDKDLRWLRVTLQCEDTGKQTVLPNYFLDFVDQLSRFETNYEALVDKNFPIDSSPDESIADAIDRYFDEVDLNNIDSTRELMDTFDEIYEYRRIHNFSFAFSDQTHPDIYFGIKDNKGEISSNSMQLSGRFRIDLADFLSKLKDARRQYFSLINRPVPPTPI